MTWGTNYSICLGCSLLKLCSKSLQHVHPYGSCCSSCTPPTRTHAFARCSTGFTRKRVSCSNSDNEIIWTLGSPGQLVPLFARRRCIKIRVKIQNSVNSTFPDIIEQLHGNSYRPSFIPHKKYWGAAECCWSVLPYFVGPLIYCTISFKKHGTACTGLLLQPRNSTHTSDIELSFFLLCRLQTYMRSIRAHNETQTIYKNLKNIFWPIWGATSGPFKAPHAPGLEDPTKVTESWVLVTSGMVGMANR